MEENQQKEENPINQPKKTDIQNIFKPHHIDLIYNSQDPIIDCTTYFESNYRAKYGRPDFEKTKLLAKAEFAVNVLIFLKETFPNFESPVLCKLLNLYCSLIEMENNDSFSLVPLAKKKLEEFKNGLFELNLIPKMKSEVALSKEKDKKITQDGKFFLNKEEIKKLLGYIDKEFLPYIQIWYYINNEERKVEDKKISIIINKPMESLPLSLATKKEVETKQENEEEKKEEEKKEEENKEEEKKEEVEVKEDKKAEEPENINDLLNRLISNEETRKIILEKIEELNKEVENKIENRMIALDTKLKEIEDAGKPGAKKK